MSDSNKSDDARRWPPGEYVGVVDNHTDITTVGHICSDGALLGSDGENKIAATILTTLLCLKPGFNTTDAVKQKFVEMLEFVREQ